MQVINIWDKLYLYCYKIVGVCLVLSFLSIESIAQVPGALNLNNFDEQSVHYGFMIGGNSSRFRLSYSDLFIDPSMDSVHSILPTHKFGFKIGFIVNFHLFQYLDLRIVPTFGFYQLGLDYRYDNGDVYNELRDPTYFELPILFKYKSVRRINRAMYVLGGITPAIKVSGTKKGEDPEDILLLNKFNLSLEVGVGLDLYQPLFKFSPEVRYAYGLMNALSDNANDFSAGIDKLLIHSFSIYIAFEGGPSTLRKRSGKY